MTNAMVLVVDGDIHGHYTDKVCFERFIGQLFKDPEGKDPILSYDDLDDMLTNYNEVYIESVDNILYSLHWENGSLWAIHPNAEWIDQLDQWHIVPEHSEVYTIEHNLFYAIVYNDYTGLSSFECDMIDRWCDENDIQDLVVLGDTQLAECDINSLLCENLVVCYAVYKTLQCNVG